MQPYLLVVDPSVSRSEQTVAALGEFGLPAHLVRDGDAALALIQTAGAPTVLVTELSLPKIAGFEVIRRLRLLPGGARTRVVILSAIAVMREAAERLWDVLHLHAILSSHASEAEIADAVRPCFDASSPPPSRTPRRAARAAVVDDPGAEARRLSSLRDAGILDAPAEESDALVGIVRRVAMSFGVPVGLVSLVLEDKQWFKARVGLDVVETPLDVSFCRHVKDAREPMIVPDAHVDPVFRTNALVEQGVVRGYAGAPLTASDGEVWGALCIIDPVQPLHLGAEDVDELAEVAREVVRELEKARRVPTT
ncbi:GAF domain-containing protein [bacterium]|nr:MAG: GAF domain-containing protein [bacterium]